MEKKERNIEIRRLRLVDGLSLSEIANRYGITETRVGQISGKRGWYTKRDTIPVETRFWSKVNKGGPDECWEWLGYRNNNGYGSFKYDDQTKGAHRIAWLLSNGHIPDGLNVLHKCDNPPCCNPNHLFLGTQIDNIIDMDNKSRRRAGTAERHAKAKLNWEKVRQIRALYKPYLVSTIQLGKMFGVHSSSIQDIVKNVTWRE